MPAGQLYIEGKRRPIEISDAFDAEAALERGDKSVSALDGRNGARLTFPRERVMSVKRVTEPVEPPVAIEPGFLDGKKVTFRGYPAYAQGERQADMKPIELLPGTEQGNCVVVIGEDLGAAEIAIIDVSTGAVLYANPAEPQESIDRYVTVVRLLAEADALMMAANTPEGYEPTVTRENGAEPDQQLAASDDPHPATT